MVLTANGWHGPYLHMRYFFQAPDLDDVKESVRQGVTKVASKLSSLANDFASSIQVPTSALLSFSSFLPI